MKRGQIVEGKVTDICFPTTGIIEAEGKKIYVKKALDGQTVRCRVKKTRSGTAEASLLEVMERSPREQISDCPHAGVCGGCVYRTLPYEEQLLDKERCIKKLLSQAECEQTFEGIKPSPVVDEYRNKMEFTFGDEYRGGPMSLGMHVTGHFHDIVTVSGCRIMDADFRLILTEVLKLADESGLPYYRRMAQSGYFRHLLVRKASKTGEILVDIVTASRPDFAPHMPETPDAEMARQAELFENRLVSRLQALSDEGAFAGKLTGVLHTVNDAAADAVLDGGTTCLAGWEFFTEELLGLKFRISPFSFFQTNSRGAEVLYDTVREFAGETNGKVIFDLYSGTGTIAQILAPVAEHVTGVEIVEEAVEAARENAALNGLDNCTFIAGDVLKTIDELQDKPDLIILDPPRDGIHPKALPKIIRFGVEHIVYVSCKPTSLVRDLEVLSAAGYRVERSAAVDMFPGTPHVETVVLLSKGDIDSKKVHVEMDLEGVDMSGFQKGATYEAIKGRVEAQTGLKVSSLYIAQVKQKYGIIERENCNKPKTEDTKQPKCPPEKEKAIEDALRYFNMI